ncbi:MAG TPA: lytic transglycosylase domain-containing protein [Bryobacteraceae bacterium]|nr:lytic transglycosylase domain-containing protein [Bryobacteraceae bacterium]
MKIITRVIALCACIFAAHIIDRLINRVPHSLAVALRIPAPQFTLNEVIHAASHKYKVPPAFIKSIIAAESAFSPQAVSPKGAVGLMQLMPETARQFGADPSIPEQNVDAGANYLGSLLHRYANKKHPLQDTIAAYNAGPGAVEKYKGIPPFRETRAYVSRVMRYFAEYQKDDPAPAGFASEPRYTLASVTVRNPRHWRPRHAIRRYRAVTS